ncbi:MAG TPA: type III pantothenate kinase [Rickettsiales bacterium]|nr:type III pantothenate kinase [Rickettsiales bacterium]
MLLAIDIGNTNIVIGLYNKDLLTHRWRLISDVNKPIDDYAVDIIELFLTEKIDALKISGCIIASVVPSLSEKIKKAVAKFFAGKILLIGEKNVKLYIKIKVKNKNEVGADRLINAIAAYKEFGGNLIIIDFGTATTFDIVGKNGEYLGGVIAPGINLSLKALHDMTAKLPKIEIKKQKNVIGKNTVEAMNSGVFFGYISLVEGLVIRIEKELKTKTKKITTGGLAPLFNKELKIKHHRDNLTLDGLREVYEHN